MGWTRFFVVAGVSFIVTGIRADVSTVKNAREVMLTVGGILLILGILTFGTSQNHTKRQKVANVKQQ